MQFFDVDINEYLDILKGVGAQIVIWTFYDQVVKVEKGWVEQEFVLLIINIAKWNRVAKWVNILQDNW